MVKKDSSTKMNLISLFQTALNFILKGKKVNVKILYFSLI